VKQGDFYRHEHKLVYLAIVESIDRAKPADVVTVYEQLKSMGKADDVGGVAYLNKTRSVRAQCRKHHRLCRDRAKQINPA
jgi:replicative DNA helicase